MNLGYEWRVGPLLWILLLAPPTDGYSDAVDDLDRTLITITEMDPEEAIDQVSSAIDAVLRHPQLVSMDTRALASLGRARLTMAWLLLVEGDQSGAESMVDEALLAAQGTSLPAGEFGPKVKLLHDERKRALDERGSASIAVDCGLKPCQVIIDERRAANPSAPLYFGTYRVWIGTGDGPWEYHEVTVSEGGSTVAYAGGATEVSTERAKKNMLPPVGIDSGLEDVKGESARERIMPVWAEVLGVVLGVGGVVAGGVFLGLEGRCTDGGALEQSSCSYVWDTRPAVGYALVSVGAASLVAFSPVLAVDESRAKPKRVKPLAFQLGFRF